VSKHWEKKEKERLNISFLEVVVQQSIWKHPDLQTLVLYGIILIVTQRR